MVRFFKNLFYVLIFGTSKGYILQKMSDEHCFYALIVSGKETS